ncbi:MAG TPA: HlyD family efflux transporter periplasmic adaptor subunit [Polyangiales bacterium]|nr:HlyD family efflux transporter periplasmic adaptor subunit [Polyangiales bacterium]
MDARQRRRIVGRIITWAVVLGVLGLIGLGFVPKPVAVTLGKVEQRPLEVTVDEPGKTRIRNKYVISAPVTGNLSRITLRAGDIVEVGALVGELSPVAPQLLDERTRAEANARVAVAQANLARTKSSIERANSAASFAKDQAARTRKLHAESGASKQALEQSEYQEKSAADELASANLGEKVAANELEAARAVLASISGKGGTKLPLIAPVRGEVLRVYQESEGVVQLGAPLVEIGDPHALELVVDVLSTDAVRIAPGAPVHIERWGGDHALEARVRTKQPSAFTTRSALGVEEQRVPVVIDIVEDPKAWSTLGDNYRVEARIQVASLPSAVVAPASALFRDEGAWRAFTIAGEQAKKVQVDTGARTPDWVEVRGGLKVGDRVVLFPSDTVVDGVKLAPQSPARE